MYFTYWTGYYSDDPHTEWRHSTKMTGYSGITIGNPAEIYKQTPLKYCPLSDLIKWLDKLYYVWDENAAYIKMFATYCRCPLIEMEVKFNMDEMVKHHLLRSGIDGKINKRKKKPDEIYKIYPERVKQLRNAKYVRLVIFQREKKEEVRYTDKEVEFLENNEHYLSTIDELLKYMTLEQLMNRIEKYKAEKNGYNRSDYEVYTHYRDYLSMRAELGYEKYTNKQSDIKLIQEYLNWALDAHLEVDGCYGPATTKAVEDFQKKVGITADGSYGKQTLAAAKSFIKAEKAEEKPHSEPQTENKPKYDIEATHDSKSYDKALSGEYRVNSRTGLNIRDGAGTGYKVLIAIPLGTKVECYGHYTDAEGIRWLYVAFDYDGKRYAGFASGIWLRLKSEK